MERVRWQMLDPRDVGGRALPGLGPVSEAGCEFGAVRPQHWQCERHVEDLGHSRRHVPGGAGDVRLTKPVRDERHHARPTSPSTVHRRASQSDRLDATMPFPWSAATRLGASRAPARTSTAARVTASPVFVGEALVVRAGQAAGAIPASCEVTCSHTRLPTATISRWLGRASRSPDAAGSSPVSRASCMAAAKAGLRGAGTDSTTSRVSSRGQWYRMIDRQPSATPPAGRARRGAGADQDAVRQHDFSSPRNEARCGDAVVTAGALTFPWTGSPSPRPWSLITRSR